MKHNLFSIFCLIFVVLILAACGGSSTTLSESAPPADTPTVPTATPIPPTNTPVPPTNTPIPPTDTPIPPTNTPALPTSGKWTGSAEFGKFEFILNPDSTGITKITYKFSGWACGPTTQSGTIAIGQETGWEGWPVSSGKFTIENRIDPMGNQKMIVVGTFDDTGKQASGTWNAVSHGTPCKGSWEASFSE